MELWYWRFLDSWNGFLPWQSEWHLRLVLFFDPSHSGYWKGGCLESVRIFPSQVRGSFDDRSRTLLVAARESQAMLNTMEGLLSSTRNARVDAFVDNNVLLACWGRQVSRCPIFSEIFKKYFSSPWAWTYLWLCFIGNLLPWGSKWFDASCLVMLGGV